MDSYDQAKERLDLITSEAGWYTYCLPEEEWHLYNDEGSLLFAAPTIEELADSKCEGAVRMKEGASGDLIINGVAPRGMLAYTTPVKTDEEDAPELTNKPSGPSMPMWHAKSELWAKEQEEQSE